MSRRRREPVKNTCPDIDRIISTITTICKQMDSCNDEYEKDKKKYVKECVYGSFERTFVVPEVDADKAKAEFKDGVLNITIPKKEEKKGKSISIE